MGRSVTIVDYGVGNLFSVARAIESVGGEPVFASRFADVRDAERLLLPGVGAFEPCSTALREKGLADGVMAFVETGRPFLGICVGMQLLFDYSLEFGRHEGLGLIPGHVGPIPGTDDTGTRKVPHIGWSRLLLPKSRESWTGTILAGQPDDAAAYFVHSYNCFPQDDSCRLANADYQGFPVCAAIRRENITAFQCHPEKSGKVGLGIVSNFLDL